MTRTATSMQPVLQAALRRAVLQVPGDVLVALMELLSPADRDSRAGLVSKAWLEAAMDPCHWGGLVEPQVGGGQRCGAAAAAAVLLVMVAVMVMALVALVACQWCCCCASGGVHVLLLVPPAPLVAVLSQQCCCLPALSTSHAPRSRYPAPLPALRR
jgi:hypothetical protein